MPHTYFIQPAFLSLQVHLSPSRLFCNTTRPERSPNWQISDYRGRRRGGGSGREAVRSWLAYESRCHATGHPPRPRSLTSYGFALHLAFNCTDDRLAGVSDRSSVSEVKLVLSRSRLVYTSCDSGIIQNFLFCLFTSHSFPFSTSVCLSRSCFPPCPMPFNPPILSLS